MTLLHSPPLIYHLCRFYLFGFGLAYGNAGGTGKYTLIGDDYFALGGKFEEEQTWHGFFFQFVFAATAATIVSGAVAERCQMLAYAGYSFFLTAFVYPVVVHQIWYVCVCVRAHALTCWRVHRDDMKHRTPLC